MTDAILGLDLGTSSVKALIVGVQGQVLGRGQSSYPTLHPQPEWDEQRPDDWWQAVVNAVGNARRFAPNANVVAIGITGQMHGTVLLGADRQPLGPAIIWSDRRTADLVGTVEGERGIPRLIGGPLGAGYQALTLAWLGNNEPHLIGALHHALLPTSYLGYLLTGQLVTVPSDAVSTGLYDIERDGWSDAIVNMLEVQPRWLPPVRPEGALVGYLTAPSAEELDLPAGIAVHHGGGDALAAAVATGVTGEGDVLFTISTSAQILRPAVAPIPEPRGRWHTWPSALPADVPGAHWAQVGALMNGGRVIDWIHRTLAPDLPLPELSDLAQTAPAGANGLLFLPYLAGERSPLLDPLARGAFLGLSDHHTPADLVRSVLEGLALSMADTLDQMIQDAPKPSRLVVAGGGVSPFARQILASVLGRKLEVTPAQDGSTLGAARMAAHQHGVAAIQAGTTWEGVPLEVVQPNPVHEQLYRERLDIFREAVDCNLPLMHRLQQP